MPPILPPRPKELPTNPDARERLVEALSRIVRQIQARGDLGDLLQTILVESRALLDAEASMLFLFDAEHGALRLEVGVGGEAWSTPSQVTLLDAVIGAAAREQRPIVVNDASTDDRVRALHGGAPVRNLVCAPLIRYGVLIGVVEVLNKRTGAFDDLDARVLEILAEQAAAHIEQTRLTRGNLEAERRAALGTAAAGLAHYINNVLGQWQGSAGLIDVGLERGDLALIAQAWPLLRRSHERITLLVQDMLDLAKPRAPERAEVDLAEIAHQVADAERERARRLGVTLTVHAEAVPYALLDRVRIYEVVTNLVANALDALEEAARGGAVRIAVTYEDDALVLRVFDDGPGIPESVRGRIFDPFFSTKGSRGTGLGLSLVAKTVEEHQGQVSVTSEPGAGAEFVVRLPRGGAPR